MSDQGHNPGMSEKAWQKFHEIMALLNIKYAPKVQEELKKTVEDSKVG